MQGERLTGDGVEFGRSFDPVKFLLLAGRLGKAGLGSGSGGALPLAHVSDLLLRSLVAGVDFGGMEELGQRALKVARSKQFAAFGDVHRRGGDANARERDPESRVLRIASVGLLVKLESGVVVLAGLGGLALLEVGVGRFRVKPGGRDAEAGRCGQKREGQERQNGAPSRCHGSNYGLCGRAMVHTAPKHGKRELGERGHGKGGMVTCPDSSGSKPLRTATGVPK